MIGSWLDDIVVGLVAGVLVALLTERLRRRKSVQSRGARNSRRVLFPFVGRSTSNGALDAAIRLASAEDATLVPAFLARVPLRLSLDAATPRQGEVAVELLEAIEQRALRAGVPVDSRIVRGRTAQHALQELTESEHYYRIVLPAASGIEDGLDAGAIAWCLDNAPGEIVVLRPGGEPPVRRRIPRWRSQGSSRSKKRPIPVV